MAHSLLCALRMANLPRHAILEDDSTFHVTWQCHNHTWLLKQPWAKQLYYKLLLKYKVRWPGETGPKVSKK